MYHEGPGYWEQFVVPFNFVNIYIYIYIYIYNLSQASFRRHSLHNSINTVPQVKSKTIYIVIQFGTNKVVGPSLKKWKKKNGEGIPLLLSNSKKPWAPDCLLCCDQLQRRYGNLVDFGLHEKWSSIENNVADRIWPWIGKSERSHWNWVKREFYYIHLSNAFLNSNTAIYRAGI